MGVVFQARHRWTGDLVAIKTLRHVDREALERLVHEACLMNSISHDNVIHILEVGLSDDGVPFLVMEHLPGFTTADWIARNDRFSERQLRPILPSMFDGIDAIHRAGVLHRDIKPSNVFVCVRAGEVINVKIIDFGISARPQPRGDSERIPGTPPFIAPEVLLEGRAFSVESDVYATALTVYTLLTGANPFHHDDLGQTVAAIRDGHLPPIPFVSRDINDAIRRGVAADPQTRGSLRDLLSAVCAHRGRTSSWPAA